MNSFTSKRFARILSVSMAAFCVMADAQTPTMNWSQAGPVYAAGRTRNMIVDNANSSILYVGSASSGLFKSSDGGAYWTPINDQSPVKNISFLAQSKNGTIYAATGEGFLRYAQKARAQAGTGLYRLSGPTLVSLPASTVAGAYINRVACSPLDDNKIAIAGEKGVFISNDGGQSFSPANGVASSSLIAGMDVKFTSAGILYCTAGNERGHTPYNTVLSKVYKSDDTGLGSFTAITPTSTAFTDAYGRIELGISASNASVIYVSVANKNTTPPSEPVSNNSPSLRGIFVSYNGGTSWSLLLQGSPQLDPLSSITGQATGDYAHVITVHPTNPDLIIVGGFATYIFVRDRNKGSDANPIGLWYQLGSRFAQNTPYYLHENTHDVKIIPGSATKYYFITDAGIYRSTDIVSFDQDFPPSFQPFYKGLVTGQFNSVSIERYPITQGPVPTTGGQSVTPNSGFIGGTSGSGLNYFSGTAQNVAQEVNLVMPFGQDVYEASYSRVLTDAAVFATGPGYLYRSANVKSSEPAAVNVVSYKGPLSRLVPTAEVLQNYGVSNGSVMKLWENWGQRKDSPDSVIFYNDSLRFQASITGSSTAVSFNNMLTLKSFVFSAARPAANAVIDSIVVRTGTAVLPATTPSLPTKYEDRKTVFLKLKNSFQVGTYTVVGGSSTGTVVQTNTVAVFSGTNLNVSGPITTSAAPSVTLNSNTSLDEIAVTFDDAPFKAQPTASVSGVPDVSAYYRVYATVYYKYKAGDAVHVIDNNISTKSYTYSTILKQPLSWTYGTPPPATFTTIVNSALSNPTFVLNPGNVAQSSPVFTINTIGQKSYTVTQYGDYTVAVNPVIYRIEASKDTTLPGTSYMFSLTPGGQTMNIAKAGTVTATFTVSPTAPTTYTIIQYGTPTTNVAYTYSSVTNPTYQLNPGNVTQSTNIFSITVPPSSAQTTYTLQGLSADTLLGKNTSTTSVLPKTYTTMAGTSEVPFATKSNPYVKIATWKSARLAMALNHTGVTGNADAIVVSKNPLALNDPINFVRVSQSGALSDDNNGAPSSSVTTVVNGRPNVIEWSKKGTELYYATDAKELYRVSHITDIRDFSPSSYNGKFYTDIFKYSGSTPNADAINPASPYRTTRIGKFDRPITSISISNDDKKLIVTFNGASTGTTPVVVMNASPDIRVSGTNTIWDDRQGALAGKPTYCSMVEKDNRGIFVGTDQGLYFTADITPASPSWVNVNSLAVDDKNWLPAVQVFDIEQQLYDHWDAYNSGEIYVATYGRGVWSNSAFRNPYLVGVEEHEMVANIENALSLFPNPTSGNVNIAFDAVDGETAGLEVLDISGRQVKQQPLGKMNAGEARFTLETSDLNSGIYIVNISSTSGKRRVSKLIVTR